MTMVTAPNAAIPAGLKKPTFDDISNVKGHAAGVLFVNGDGEVLLLRRSPKETNFAGHWALPGGGVEDGETPELGAARELKEEMGVDFDPKSFRPIDKRATPNGLAYHTFGVKVPQSFAPTLNPEHTGYAWASLDMLPRPLHPAVEKTLRERIGLADDMHPEARDAMRDGLLKYLDEEPTEPEHATDSALRLALDRDSVRSIDKDGRMTVAVANISKACVSPYLGKEIPGYKELGLDADKVYNLLRHPDELAKAAPTFNGVQLLKIHKPVNADDHRKNDIVGTTGTTAEFDGTYLKNSLHIWSQDGIDLIESGKQRELSPGYHYVPVMTPGNFDGMHFDGIMTNIVGNHVALVEDGRTGPDVVVGDSKEELNKMKPTRLAVHALQLTSAAIAPLLAQDAKFVLSSALFAPITSKNVKDSGAKVIDACKLALDGKLRSGIAMDGALGGVKKVFDALEELSGGEKGMDEPVEEKMLESAGNDPLMPTATPMQPADKGKTFDAEPLKAFLKEKGMADDDIMKACDMFPKAALDEEVEDPKTAANEGKEPKDPEANDEKDEKDMVSKGAMDAALEAQSKKIRETERGIRVAIAKVETVVGKLAPSLAFDSATDVFRHALKMKGVKAAETMHADAVEAVFDNLPVASDRPKTPSPRIALDAKSKDFHAEIGVDVGRVGVGAI